MAKLTRRAGDSRYRFEWAEVPIDSFDEAAGTIFVRLADIPHTLRPELQDEANDAISSLDRLLKELEALPPQHREARKAEREAAYAAQAAGLCRYLQWGLAGHRGLDEELEDGTVAPFPFESVDEVEKGRPYKIAAPGMIDAYAAFPAGCLIVSLKEAVENYQRGTIRSPRQIWDERKAFLEKLSAGPAAERCRVVTPAGEIVVLRVDGTWEAAKNGAPGVAAPSPFEPPAGPRPTP